MAAPLAARVLAGAPAASVAVLAAWLAAEVVGGFAVRRSVLLGSSMVRALAGGLGDPFRAPLATALTVAVALGATLVALVATWWVTGVAWEAARQALGGDLDALAVLGAAILMAARLAGRARARGRGGRLAGNARHDGAAAQAPLSALLHCAACAADGQPPGRDRAPRMEVGDPTA